MRSLADNASKILGQPVIVENKPGAGGTLPAQTLQTSPADGYAGADSAGRVPPAVHHQDQLGPGPGTSATS